MLNIPNSKHSSSNSAVVNLVYMINEMFQTGQNGIIILLTKFLIKVGLVNCYCGHDEGILKVERYV